MWLIAPAVPLLLISAIVSAFLAEAYHKPVYALPSVLVKYERLFVFFDIILFISGVTLVVTAFGWWGLVSVVVYWLFVVMVLMPAGTQKMLQKVFGEKLFACGEERTPDTGDWIHPVPGAGEPSSDQDIIRKTQVSPLKELTIDELRAMRERFKEDKILALAIDEILREKDSNTL